MSASGLAFFEQAFTEALEEELFFQDDPIVEDPVEAALDRDLDRWVEQKDEPLVSDVPVQCFSSGDAASSSWNPRPLSEGLAGLRQTLGKNFKYGHCPTCSVALQPIVHKSGLHSIRPVFVVEIGGSTKMRNVFAGTVCVFVVIRTHGPSLSVQKLNECNPTFIGNSSMESQIVPRLKRICLNTVGPKSPAPLTPA